MNMNNLKLQELQQQRQTILTTINSLQSQKEQEDSTLQSLQSSKLTVFIKKLYEIDLGRISILTACYNHSTHLHSSTSYRKARANKEIRASKQEQEIS